MKKTMFLIATLGLLSLSVAHCQDGHPFEEGEKLTSPEAVSADSDKCSIPHHRPHFASSTSAPDARSLRTNAETSIALQEQICEMLADHNQLLADHNETNRRLCTVLESIDMILRRMAVLNGMPIPSPFESAGAASAWSGSGPSLPGCAPLMPTSSSSHSGYGPYTGYAQPSTGWNPGYQEGTGYNAGPIQPTMQEDTEEEGEGEGEGEEGEEVTDTGHPSRDLGTPSPEEEEGEGEGEGEEGDEEEPESEKALKK